MRLDETQRAAVELAGDVKGRLVTFAQTTPFERHLRQTARELAEQRPDADDLGVEVIEALLFSFTYDDGSTVVDRFAKAPGVTDAERETARRFLDGTWSIFEVLDYTPAAAEIFRVRCCLSDLEHVVGPTEPVGMPELARGSFLNGRLNPIAGTDLWTTSGTAGVLPPEFRAEIAKRVSLIVQADPQVTHRNPHYRERAHELSAEGHDRFVARHGSDTIVVAGKEAPETYADAVAPPPRTDDAADVAASLAGWELTRRTIEETGVSDAESVLLISHPVAGVTFYRDFDRVARALDAGSAADPGDLEVLRGCLDDDSVPAWALRRMITDRLPSSEPALAKLLRRHCFDWDRDGERLLTSLPGEVEPAIGLAVLPSICRSS